jgi:hypothetical protein
VEDRVQVLKPWTEVPRQRLCDVLKIINSLKLRKAWGTHGIPNDCLRHLSKRPMVHLTHLFNQCCGCRIFHHLGGSKVITSPKPGKDPKFPQNLRQISISTTGRLSEKVILTTVQRHAEKDNVLNACQFGFRARHSTMLQFMRLTDHGPRTTNFQSVSKAAVFLDIEKASDTTWHPGLLYKLPKLHFFSSLMELISSFLSNRKFRVMVEDELSTPRDYKQGAARFRPGPYPVQSLQTTLLKPQWST